MTVLRWLRAGYGVRTWRELAWTLTAFPVVLLGLASALLPLAVGALLVPVGIGLPLLVAGLAVVNGFAGLDRRRARRLLRVVVEPPDRGGSAGGIRDVHAWRALLYLGLELPIAAVGLAVAVLGWTVAGAALSYPVWYRAQAASIDATVLDSPGQVAAVAGVGAALALILPWALRGLCWLAGALVTALLTSRPTDRRVRELARTRSHAVTDAAETLRRVERDLHDGAQARMVAVAVDLGVAREMLDAHPDPGPARELLELAHANTQTAITELRDLARGIHPAALDHGLDTALATLTSGVPLPVHLHVDPLVRPDPPIAAIVYFCAAELLANALKHSGARSVRIDVDLSGPAVRLRVRDDGDGGARLRGTGGLAGLRDRVATVDGSLTIDSPAGGPTVVTAEVPARA